MGQKEFAALCNSVDLFNGDWSGDWDGGSELTYRRFELQPDDFLRQAELDLEKKTQGGDQNAIANAKRAIFCQIDQILSALGYKPERWRNDRRVSTIASMGFAGPRIIGKINATRNLLEHSYRLVSRAEAEDAVDVAALFGESAAPVLRLFPTDLTLGVAHGNWIARGIDVRFTTDGSATFHLDSFGIDERETVSLTSVDFSFPFLVGLSLAIYREGRVAEAFEALRASSKHKQGSTSPATPDLSL